ncbi:nutrient deprivation-induced protein [Rhizobium sp. LjRoot98]|uniref:hypothetical protein n=1 Tax=unclassified Rhizobium TaxID=2613769 RepID=UPI0007135BD8|nr:hypothetical protein [Rhizobium sp. Root1204]KQV35272.1 nutrient deprivation-induced protein [Rhizobium sp. Root1204]
MQNEFIDPPVGSNPGSLISNAHTASPDGSEDVASFSDLKEKLTEDISNASAAIKAGAESASEKVKDAMSDQATFVATQVGGVATALQKVGSELEGSEQADIGKYATQIGRSVEGFAKRMEGKDIGEIANMAEEFGRKQPLAFLGIAALAGLTASRFLTASAKRTKSSSIATSNTSFDPSMTEGRGNG